MTSVRPPAVAGQFYEGSAAALREQLEATFTHELGPGEVPQVGEGQLSIRALVAPHAGYPYSGPVAAHSYAALARAGRPDAVVIVGPNHSGRGEAIAVTEADTWETPLGQLTVHDALRQTLLDRTDGIVVDERTHAGEHSIEVQIPYLQYLFESVPILPIAMTRQDETTVKTLAAELADLLEAEDARIPIVASTDFTHYQPQSVAEEQDRLALDRIEALDASGLLETVSEEGISMCGYGPTAAAIEAATRGGAAEGRVLKYATSGDTAGPAREVVGYAAAVIR
jgi:hypothetical protein